MKVSLLIKLSDFFEKLSTISFKNYSVFAGFRIKYFFIEQ